MTCLVRAALNLIPEGGLVINPFLDACGATGPLVLGTESAGVPGDETRAFHLPFVLAGGDPRSDLRLNHPDVSDRHAYLQLVDGQLVCIDLGSRIGIYQGGRCQRRAYLERGQAARIGPYRIRLIGGDADAGTGLSRDSPCPPLPLALSHRGVRDSRCELPRGLALVGSATDCQIRLIDPSVSNYHCSLIHTSHGVWVVDLLSQGGVRVNGQEVDYAQVHEGNSLQIGHSVIRILAASDSDAPLAEVVDREPQTPAAQTVELVEQVLGPIVSQVGLLQRQMVEEFQQSRAMLFETFATPQQEQRAFLNQELDQIRQLSQELHSLRADLERQTRLLADQIGSAALPTRLGTATASAPRPASAPPSNRSGSLLVVVTRPHLNGHGPSNGNGNGNGTHTPPPASSPRHEATIGLVRAHSEDAHARLCDRIARLQTKRQTRWEKLLALFPKATPGKSTT